MEAITYLTGWVDYLLIVIPVSAIAMVTYFAMRKSLSTDTEESGHYSVRIKQTLKGSIIAISISGFIEIIKVYYN